MLLFEDEVVAKIDGFEVVLDVVVEYVSIKALLVAASSCIPWT